MKEVARGKRDKNALTHPKPRAPYTFEMAEQKKGRKEIDATTKKQQQQQQQLHTALLEYMRAMYMACTAYAFNCTHLSIAEQLTDPIHSNVRSAFIA